MPTESPRPILRMPTHNSTSPQWLREAKANREQLQYAYDLCIENCRLARERYEHLVDERDAATALAVTPGSAVTAQERAILAIQERVFVAAQEWERHSRDVLELRSELMGVKS